MRPQAVTQTHREVAPHEPSRHHDRAPRVCSSHIDLRHLSTVPIAVVPMTPLGCRSAHNRL